MRSRRMPVPPLHAGPRPIGGAAFGHNDRIDKRPAPAAARPQQPRRSCFGRAAGDRRDGGAGMPAGGRVKVSIGIIESNTDRPTGVSDPAFRGKDRQHHCCASHDRVDRSIDTGRQPVEQKLNLKRITSAASRSPAGRGDALRAPASHASRDRRTAQAHRSSPSGKSNQQGGSEQPARSSTAAPAAQLHSTSDRDSQQRGICSVRQKNFAKKEERLAPLNFLSALALRLRVVVKRHTSALHCGQIVRSSRLTLNKSQ